MPKTNWNYFVTDKYKSLILMNIKIIYSQRKFQKNDI